MTASIHEPLVSIIIPTYNRAAYVVRAVESALEQTYKNIEIIVVDDGSTDDTEQTLRTRFADERRLRYYAHHPNRGGNYARNRGLDLANGRYVTFLDSDDTYLPEKVQKQVEATRLLDPERPHVVQCQIVLIVNGVQREVDPIRGKLPNELASDYIFFNRGQSHMPLLLVSTDHARRIRFNETLPKLQDVDWFIRVFDNDPAYAFIQEGLATYYLNHDANQVSKSLPSLDIMNAWVENLGARLSPRSRAAIEATCLAKYAAHKGRRLWAIRYLANGAHKRVVSRQLIISLSTRIILPRPVHARIAPLVRTLRNYHRPRRGS